MPKQKYAVFNDPENSAFVVFAPRWKLGVRVYGDRSCGRTRFSRGFWARAGWGEVSGETRAIVIKCAIAFRKKAAK